MGYEFYLFSRLYQHNYEKELSDIPIDEEFQRCYALYNKFKKSPHNDMNKGLYECIENFLTDSKEVIISYN
jgi:hypothetical protein